MEIKPGKLPKATNYKKGRDGVIKYIVIHYTGQDGDTAAGNSVRSSENRLLKSAHYFVDEYEVFTSVPVQDIAWHCSTSGSYYHPDCRNANSIGIEMCSRKTAQGQYYIKPETVSNTAALVRYLMKTYKISVQNVLRHYDITRQNCPMPFVLDETLWEDFKNKIIQKESCS